MSDSDKGARGGDPFCEVRFEQVRLSLAEELQAREDSLVESLETKRFRLWAEINSVRLEQFICFWSRPSSRRRTTYFKNKLKNWETNQNRGSSQGSLGRRHSAGCYGKRGSLQAQYGKVEKQHQGAAAPGERRPVPRQGFPRELRNRV
ncbi:hypothetical protein THAOC_20808 [Thalassiosira oceanica]|uniref:Uncharacterized protein n=1 Tax=Thalassiosira oceanica TaxID=159749 RepID=K0SDI9_THAOC|nr:hypothetical protein THAOC_20808 [Thalassiosira oceanica]|eukprot:EJK59026.1 hypothetical protein THAOC_20808 [Thalassiosira oceanica]